MQYLVFPRVLQGTGERPVSAHGVTADGHPVRVGGEVSVDQFGELREMENSNQLTVEVWSEQKREPDPPPP